MKLPGSQNTAAWASEFLGTLLLVVVGPGAVAYTSIIHLPWLESLLVFAAAFGIIVTLVVVIAGPISGAHINPAVSLANFLAGRLKRDLLLPYIFFQVVGAVARGWS